MKLTNLLYGSVIALLLIAAQTVTIYATYATCVVNREHSPTSYREDGPRIKEQCADLHLPFFFPRP